MRPLTYLVLAVLACGISSAALADRPLREAESRNKRFHLRVRPGRPGFDAVRGCKATLFERSGERHRARKRWERFIVNDVAPAAALVRDDGQIIVTLDEFSEGGARHALVIYGQRGELLRHFLLTDLLDEADWEHVRLRRSSIDWLAGAKTEFVDIPPEFVITLKHGRRIRIDLRTLRVVRDQPASSGDPFAAIPTEIIAALFGEVATPTAPAKVGEIAEVVNATASEPEEPSADHAVSEGHDEAVVADPPVEERDAIVTEVPATDVADEEPRADAGATTMTGPVPQPDPAEPFDYLAWMNEKTTTAGPSAAPDFQTATDLLVTWEGKRDLQRAATSGDPDALASTELQDWLDVNREALAYFRNASTLEFNGWELNSDDGSLLMVRLPALGPLRELSRAAVIEGRYLAAEGRPQESADVYLDTLAAGARVSNGVTVIEDLVGIAIQRPAAEALLDLQADDVAGNIDYMNLAVHLEEAYGPTRPMGQAIELERAFFLDCVQRMYDYDPVTGDYRLNIEQTGTYFAAVETEYGEQTFNRDENIRRQAEIGFDGTVAAGNAYYDDLVEAFALPYRESIERLSTVHAEARQSDNPIMGALAPDFRNAHFHQTRSETTRRAARLVTNLRAYRQVHGVYPDSLDAFGESEITRDAFTNQHFRYALKDGDFVLYSIGANGIDDGGVHDPKGKTNDILIWPRPK